MIVSKVYMVLDADGKPVPRLKRLYQRKNAADAAAKFINNYWVRCSKPVSVVAFNLVREDTT